jgi:ATP-dependent exoDNAse (exonuclease V) alpha subunit
MPKLEIEFNQQFQQAHEILEKTKKHLFISGKAGTGKSTLLNYFRHNTTKRVVVLAPTGVAAVNIEGETIHSFCRFQPNITTEYAKKAGYKQKSSKLINNLETIIIDEISMVRADLLDCVDIFLRAAREIDQPFGGVQMVFIGDLYQLPPVIRSEEKMILEQIYRSPFFFDANVIDQLKSPLYGTEIEYIELKKIYRQKDQDFINLLNNIRNKTVNELQIQKINAKLMSKDHIPSDKYIFLTSTNALAQQKNNEKLAQLSGKKRLFEGEIEGDFDTNRLPTEIDLVLKKGARVMFMNNDPNGRWINGTLGTVIAINTFDEISVEIDNGETVEVQPFTWKMYKSNFNQKTNMIEYEVTGTFTQIPVKLAWAVTIHKSQGKTFDNVVIDIGYGTFAHGQMYVALSRCTNFDGILLKKPIKKHHVILDQRVVGFFNS